MPPVSVGAAHKQDLSVLFLMHGLLVAVFYNIPMINSHPWLKGLHTSALAREHIDGILVGSEAGICCVIGAS